MVGCSQVLPEKRRFVYVNNGLFSCRCICYTIELHNFLDKILSNNIMLSDNIMLLNNVMLSDNVILSGSIISTVCYPIKIFV
jgi:hypothetical protein